MSSWFCDYAWTGGRVAADVVIHTDRGRITDVSTGVERPADATRLRGLTLPAFANAHSHAFHRALRGRTHSVDDGGRGRAGHGGAGDAGAGTGDAGFRVAGVGVPAAPRGSGSFWTWREQMYRVAEHLDPDSYHRLARALYAEMALAGYGVVGEFHYLHHAAGGARYTEPNAMGEALAAAAADAGIRLTLLDTCYLTAGVAGEPLEGVQERFGDGDAEAWASRVEALARSYPAEAAAARALPRGGSQSQASAPGIGAVPDRAAADGSPAGLVRIGAAIHSVRAVPPTAIETVAEWAAARGAPLHVHLSEQPRENEDCLAAHGRTPTALLADQGALAASTTAVHATHLNSDDVAQLASSGTRACVTRTTERDLADGAPDLGRMAGAGIGLCVGSDSNAIVDPFEETRGLELDERSRTLRRGHLGAATLLHAATAEGYASLGWTDRQLATARDQRSGGITTGDLADFTTVSLDSVRLAGWTPETLLDHAIFAATPSDVTDTIIADRHIVRDRTHTAISHPAADLHHEIRTLLHHP